MTKEQKARQRVKEWRIKNPDKLFANRLKKYGITPDQYHDMLRLQGSKCAICMTADPGKKGWNVDHCHNTGQVRGLLCHSCNVGLGQFKDNKTALARAIDYLGDT